MNLDKIFAYVSKDMDFYLLSFHLHLSRRQNFQIILISSTVKVVFEWAPPFLEISDHRSPLCLFRIGLEITATMFIDQNKIKTQLDHCKKN